MEECGHPVSHSQLRECVALLNVSTGGQECGHNWTQRFLTRRPELRAKMGTKIDTLRLENTTPDKLKPWFESRQASFIVLNFKQRLQSGVQHRGSFQKLLEP